MDTLSEFTLKLEKEFEDMEPGSLKPETSFREIPNWSSMHALIIIALADTEYDTKLTGEDLRKCTTVNDIYNILQEKQS